MSRTLGQELKLAMESFAEKGEGALPGFLALYHEDLAFQDPLVRLYGREDFGKAMRKLIARCKDFSIECSDLAETADGVIYLAWTMRLSLKVAPSFVEIGPSVVVPGVTHARGRDGRIEWQRDHWDLAGSAVQAFPGLSPIYRRLTQLLA